MLTACEIIAGKYWLVNNKEGRKVGTLRSCDSGYEFYDSRTNTTEFFDSIDSFQISEKESAKDSNILVNGYPSGIAEPIPVDHETLPTFKKTPNAKSLYVAGYYIVKFEGMGWQWAFAPKLSTVDKYQYKGPFLTEWEMNLELKKHKRGSAHEALTNRPSGRS